MAAMLARMNQENVVSNQEIGGNQKGPSAVPSSMMGGQRGALASMPLG
jgi:hypothetical protein